MSNSEDNKTKEKAVNERGKPKEGERLLGGRKSGTAGGEGNFISLRQGKVREGPESMEKVTMMYMQRRKYLEGTWATLRARHDIDGLLGLLGLLDGAMHGTLAGPLAGSPTVLSGYRLWSDE